jgi:hypothetical protein
MKPLLTLLLFQSLTIQTPPSVVTIPLPAIDYGKLSKEIRFRRGFLVTPEGVQVDTTAMLTEIVYRTEPVIKPGLCRVGTDSVLPSNAIVRTPSYLYMCAPNPNGAPAPYEWARIPLQRKW